MNHRHLLPNEIDLLLDGDVGFGQTPLRAHARACEQCRSALDDARRIVAHLDHLPHVAPAAYFADRVMAQVQVFEPAHVAAANAARRWVPRSRPMRVLAAATALSLGFFISVAALWLATNAQAVAFLADLMLQRARRMALGGVSDVAAGALGAPALAALRAAGDMGLAAAAGGFLLAVVIAALGLRAVAGASRRRRA